MKYAFLFFLALSIGACQSKAQQKTVDTPPEQPAQQQTTTANQQQATKPFKDVNVEEFANLMGGENVVVLDVRTPMETQQGMVEGAIEIDVKSPDFAERISKLNKDKTYLVYCRSGRRSVVASNEMARQGFKDIYNLLGGYNAWKAAGK